MNCVVRVNNLTEATWVRWYGVERDPIFNRGTFPIGSDFSDVWVSMDTGNWGQRKDFSGFASIEFKHFELDYLNKRKADFLMYANRHYTNGKKFRSEFDESSKIRTIVPYGKEPVNTWTISFWQDEIAVRSDSGIGDGMGCSNPAIYKNGKWAELVIDDIPRTLSGAVDMGPSALTATFNNTGNLLKGSINIGGCYSELDVQLMDNHFEKWQRYTEEKIQSVFGIPSALLTDESRFELNKKDETILYYKQKKKHDIIALKIDF